VRTEVLKFYADMGKHVDRQIEKRAPGIKPAQIKAACEKFYDQVKSSFPAKEDRYVILKNGEKVKYLSIAWRIEGMAKQLKSDEFENDEKILAGAKKELKGMAEQIRAFLASKHKRSRAMRRTVDIFKKKIKRRGKSVTRWKLAFWTSIAVSVWSAVAALAYLEYYKGGVLP